MIPFPSWGATLFAYIGTIDSEKLFSSLAKYVPFIANLLLQYITYYEIWNAQSRVPYFIRGKKILFQIFQTVSVQFPFDVTYKRHYPQLVGRQLRRSVCFSRPLFIHLFIYESNCNFFYSSMIRMFSDLSALCRK